ncbi:Regulator of chromosome condensation (RCC1) repeat-containing protein [Butyrivibrio sp. YAB3001]|nr:Regulator of chromosome condensation (RCC1) repeat-containing protein [Butyrivibrio sp. YAB3001]
MNIEDKDMSEIIDSNFDEPDKKNWLVWVFTILCIAIGATVLIKFIPAITSSDDAVTVDSDEDIVELPVYYVENMDELHLDDTDFDIANYYFRNEYEYNHYYIDDDNVLWGVGDNSEGQLGIGNRSSYESTPQKMAENVIHVDGAAFFVIYLTENGELYGAGANQNGLMGLENPYGKEWIYYDDIVAATPVLLMSDVKYARASQSGIVALKDDGSVWWWGQIRTTSAKHPDDTIGCSYSEPTKMLDDAIYVTCGSFSMAAIKEDGTLWTWGNNTFGSCGYDSKNQDFIEEPVKVLDDVKMVWMDEVRFENSEPYTEEDDEYDYTYDTFAEKKDGSLYACGKYVDGEGSKIWDFKLYGDTLRTPEEYMDDGLHEPVELVYSDRFQRIQFKEKKD